MVTVCPKSPGPFLYSKILYKTGQDFFNIQYFIITVVLSNNFTELNPMTTLVKGAIFTQYTVYYEN